MIRALRSLLCLVATIGVTSLTSAQEPSLPIRQFEWARGEVVPAATLEGKKYPTANFSGVFQGDAGWFQQDEANRRSVGDVLDGAAFRRARLTAVGAVADNVDYRFQMDFAFPGRPTFTDVYFDLTQLPIGKVRVGQWKQPVGLEEITSFRFNPFMERTGIFMLKPFRRLGVGFLDHSDDEQFTWTASLFRSGQDQFGGDLTDNGGLGGAARATFASVFENDPDRIIHLGAAYHLAGPSNSTLRFGAYGGNAPEFGLFTGTFGTPQFNNSTPSFVDTGAFASNLYQLAALETATINGSFSTQAEAVVARAERPGASAVTFYGGYVFASYFLFGGQRTYDRKIGAFDRPRIGRDFAPHRDGHWLGGDIELAVRLSYLSLTDQNITGGRIADVTYAVNWYLNPYTKLSANVIQVHMDRPPVGRSNAMVYAIRGQLEF